jgi:hypothetical protein
MTKTIRTGVCTAIVGFSTAALIAQTPAVPQNPSATDQITVTGCLKEAPATAAAPGPPVAAGTGGTTVTTGTTGTAGAATDSSASQPKFVLTNASAAPAADPSAGAVSTASPTPSDAQTYRLIANPAALSPHVGKKLELTGTLESPASAAQTADAPAGPATPPILMVKAGKIIAPSCSQ